jgi:xylulokinase
VTQRLCGRAALDFHTALAWDPLLDATVMDWDRDRVSDLLGLPASRLPVLAWPGERVGTLRSDIAGELGLPSGVAVACGTADVLAESLGSGVRDVGDMMVMYGSTLFTLQRVAEFRPAVPLWPSVACAADQPTLMTGTSNAGSLLTWFAEEIAPGADLSKLYASADAVGPGAEGLICVPYLQGERAPVADPLARGLFLGLSPRHNRAHMLRALIEGVAFGFSRILKQYAAAGQAPRRLFATGGGLQVPLWPQLMSDVTGLPQFQARLPEGAALGAAMLAAFASGQAGSICEMPADWVAPAGRMEPREEGRERYARLTALQEEAYESTASLIHRLGQLQSPSFQ